MEEETNVKTSEQAPGEVKKTERPTFLTVLCILSYIGVGIAVITNLVALIAGKTSSMFMYAAKDMEGMEVETAFKSPQYVSTISAVGLISALVVLVGVIMMWKLKKKGYYIYIIGEIAPVIVSLLLIGMSGFFGGFMAIIGLIFPVLFIILYGLNVKHMA